MPLTLTVFVQTEPKLKSHKNVCTNCDYSVAICGCLKCSFSSSGSFAFCKTLINVYLLKKVNS